MKFINMKSIINTINSKDLTNRVKRLSALIFLISFFNTALAQQLPQMTQYMINNYAVNPAIAGMQDYYQVKSNIRNQWVGITDAPVTTILSVYGKKSEHVGLGGIIFNDQVGHTSRNGASISYAYHFPLTQKTKMSLALSGGFIQLKIDASLWNMQHSEDPVAGQGVMIDAVPDATFGINIYADNWYIGAAVPQLLSVNLDLLDSDFQRAYNTVIAPDGKLKRHIFVLGAYTHSFNPYWAIEPSMLFKHVSPSDPQFDFGLKTIYNDKLWFGMDYRNNGDLAALLGYSIQERFEIGYSYDIITSPELSGHTSGSHEFMIGIKFKAADESDIMR